MASLELWRAERWSFRGLIILALSAGGEGVDRIWEARCQHHPKILDDLTWNYPFINIIIIIIIIIFICLIFLLYFENKDIFCSCVWLQICSTFSNLICCSFVGFCLWYWMSLSRFWSHYQYPLHDLLGFT